MNIGYTDKQAKKVKEMLIEEFLEGKHYAVRDIIEKFFTRAKSNPLNYMLAERKVRVFMLEIKRYLQYKNGVPFGCLNEAGEYGVAVTEAEFKFMAIRKRNLYQGIIRNTAFEINNGIEKGVLSGKTELERLPIPRIKPEFESSNE